MKPEIFFNAWCRTINDKKGFKEKLLNWKEYWYNSRAKTGLMESEIYHELAKEFSPELFCCVQYYYIDAVFYLKEDLVCDIPPNTTFLRKIRIALEHENNFNLNLYQEFSHLLLIDCELRVIVSYPNNYPTKYVLDYLKKIILEQPKLNIENESILLIFGVRREKNDVYWVGYEYKDMDWQLIKNECLIGKLYDIECNTEI